MELKELMELGKRYQRYYAGRVARELCMNGKSIPDFEVGSDASAWTGNRAGREVIHIGVGLMHQHPDGTPVCETENDFHLFMRYIQGHECGHQKYTTDKGFSSTIINGVRDFVEYAYKETTGVTIRLSGVGPKETEAKCDKALKDLASNYNVRISLRMVQEFVHFIVNAIEDGRIERLCANEKPGFGNDMRACRAVEWIHTGIQNKPDSKDSREFVMTTMNQILSLATTGLWQRRFSEYLEGSDIEQFVVKLLPEIKAGVMARSCASGMRHAGVIVRAMFPYFLKACQENEMESALRKLCEQLASQIPDMDPNGNNPHSFAATEKEDANREKGSGSGQGDGDDSEGTNTGFDIFGQGDDSSSNGTSSGDNEPDANVSSEAGSNTSKDGTGSGEEKSGDAESDGNSQGNSSSHSGSNEGSEGGRSGSKGQQAVEDSADDYDRVLAAMKKAAEEGLSQTRQAEEQIRQAEAQVAAREETHDDSTAVENAGSMDDICEQFNEFKRKYEVDEDLPLFIAQECELTRKKYEEYFKSRRKPKRRNQKSGRFDAHGLSRLVRGDTDVFMRRQEDNSFSGCIEIRLDNSGSMAGMKMRCACEALARVEENLKGLVPLKITAFDMTSRTNIEIIKNWEEDLKKNCSWNYYIHRRPGGGTPTTEALLTAEREILARNEKNKLIILMTDEAEGCEGAYLKEVVKKIRKDGVQLCAIYFEEFMDDNWVAAFQRLFDNRDAIACPPDRISEELLPVIQEFTRR